MMLILANVVWPALILGGRMLAVWPIAAGLFVEFFFVRYATNLRGWRCFAGDVSMNLASAVIGVFLIPLSGFVWELLASFTLYPLLKVGTFNPVTWGVTVSWQRVLTLLPRASCYGMGPSKCSESVAIVSFLLPTS